MSFASITEDLSDKTPTSTSIIISETSSSRDSSASSEKAPAHLSLRKSSSNIGAPSASRNMTPPPSSSTIQECDYDLNPTVLYQAIEAKQWEYAISLFSKGEQEDQSCTWVVRKETNGKLRWRLLPLHAAVIFGSPLKLVELLLADYPPAAQCKDDQGMLPLHLAFRNECNWEIVDELLTAYPAAVFICDRKGRTPLQCGIRQANISSASSVSSRPGGGRVISESTKSFRAIVSVLDLYSQIAVSGERKRAEQEARTLANTSIAQLKDSHLKTLTSLKTQWEAKQAETDREMAKVRHEKQSLQERVQELERELAKKEESQQFAEEKLRMMSMALNQANERVKANNPTMHQMQRNNQMLRSMTEDMVQEQKIYHSRVQDLLKHFQEMVAEREQIRSLFMKDTNDHQEKELALVESFQKWSLEHERKLSRQEQSLEEKKVEDFGDVTPAKQPSTTSNTAASPRVPTQSVTEISTSDVSEHNQNAPKST